jgi:hypothetical protein
VAEAVNPTERGFAVFEYKQRTIQMAIDRANEDLQLQEEQAVRIFRDFDTDVSIRANIDELEQQDAALLACAKEGLENEGNIDEDLRTLQRDERKAEEAGLEKLIDENNGDPKKISIVKVRPSL